ncbi:myoD family inhibitor [Myiozetetes cayanensis]|uniref:myoD family inhibitor n=1 Tax=Myiozetetes cayanensis TaxID=478635 RepID=UPI00215EF04F|nr:myoD family inhibitor [Myiozetetes cayanensis]
MPAHPTALLAITSTASTVVNAVESWQDPAGSGASPDVPARQPSAEPPEPPRAEPVPPPEAGEPSRPSPRPIPAAPSAEPRPPARPAVPRKEKPLEDEESPKVLTKGPRAELAGTPKAVTCQPQVRPALQPPGPCTHLLQNGRGLDPGGANGDAGNGLFRPLPSTQKPHRKLQSHQSINSQNSKKSKGSSKSASSHIPIEAQEDCCVHCILSCLFCEFLTLCNIVLDCATCGSCTSEDSCICCCCCNSGECADCDLPCDMDCGIIDACCESADCLEICMECCGLCFSS